MKTVDFKKEYKAQYSASKAAQLVDLPPRSYLMFDGKGDPNTVEAYKTGVPALFSLAYGLRAALKAAYDTAYTVMPLEGLWWVREGEEFSFTDRENWEWKLLIMQPDVVKNSILDEVRQAVTRKKPNPALENVRLEQFHEGLSAQILHVGPFADEPATIAWLDAFITAQNCVHNGKHHEIYLSNFQRTPPEKLKTIIRHPVRKA